MPEPRAVDRLEVLVVVDNATDSLSTNPPYVIPEWIGLLKAGRLPVISGERICHAHHGLSLLISAWIGDERRTVLFDTGPDAATFLRNAGLLDVDFSTVDAVVLSHGHWDHGGGLTEAVASIAAARGLAGVPCFVHPGMFVQRATQRPEGGRIVHARIPDPPTLTRAGASVISTTEAQAACEGMFYVSGEIPRVTSYERGLPGHVRLGADGVSWEPDPQIIDERFIAVRVKDKGLVVFSACSHAGIINVLTHARAALPEIRLYGVMGGLHLSGSTEAIIPETIADLVTFDLKLLAPGHCTGWRAIAAMTPLFGDRLVPSAVGKRYLI